MRLTKSARGMRVAALACGLGLAACAGVLAQPVTTSGSQLQGWLDQKLSWAGVDTSSGCHFMNSHDPLGRVLFLSCPNGWSAKIQGKARVQGDEICTTFAVPGTDGQEKCYTWRARADGRYDEVRQGAATATLVLLGR